MKVLVTGANGQLGQDVIRELKEQHIECLGTTRDMLDLTDEHSAHRLIIEYSPDIVVHCAAYTAVDKAEDEIELCRKVNVDGTKYVVDACKVIDAKLMYISTDYVFPGTGTSFYQINDEKGPKNVYGQSKLDGEKIVKQYLDKYFIVRISWVFGIHGNNFVKTMLRLGETHSILRVVEDQIGSPTYTEDLSKLLVSMIQTDKYGIYQAHNEGVCSWAEFARTIFKLANMNVTVESIPSSEYPTKAIRPLNSRMDTTKLIECGFNKLPEWQDGLMRYIAIVTNQNL
ncbi:MAG: dTDP-4-dehydrorhamnose reductase [Veillonella sp.]|jgi:dTDP-4-dehydrorhamnose reductase|nr:dTDP-4-dehydrorhamnose reductase [Veillonella sp.]